MIKTITYTIAFILGFLVFTISVQRCGDVGDDLREIDNDYIEVEGLER
jgi:hypothetical protein